ncbi:MAG: efflux transporter outer membrane subunit [Steroidobacteraceae bacterium]
MRSKSVWGGICAAVFIAGCAVDRFSPDTPALPAAFQGGSSVADNDVRTPVFAAFGCPELDELIATAQRNSPDLAAAVARVRQADARARQAGAAILPEVDASASATQFGGGSHGVTAHETDWSALLSASYELDFWGKNRAARNAAQALANANRADLDTARMTILSAVAGTFFRIQALRERIALARLNLKTANDVLQFIQSRYDAGALGPAELAAQRAAVANAELQIPQLQQQESEAVGTLALLVGSAPEGFMVGSRSLDTIAEPEVSPGLPAALLRRRPDLVAAEYNLRAAHADLIAARAALFPSLTLTASGGVANPAVQAAVITLTGTGYSLTAGADLVQTIFDNGRRRAITQAAAAHEQELLAGYRGAILSALSDVENALAEIQHLDAQKQAQQENLAQSKLAFEGSQLRYREGSAEYVSVLESQRILYAAREQLSEYKLARLQALLGLSKALGGGWQGNSGAPVALAVQR